MKKNNFYGFIGCILDGFRVLFGFKSKIDLISDIVVGPSGTTPKPGPTPGTIIIEIHANQSDYEKLLKNDPSVGYVIIPLTSQEYDILDHANISKSSIFFNDKPVVPTKKP